MSEVKRYGSAVFDSGLIEMARGDYVTYSDYQKLVAENADINDRLQKLIQIVNNADNSYCMCGDSMESHVGGGCGSPTGMFDYHYNAWLESEKETPATDAFTAELRAQGVDEFAKHCKQKAEVRFYNFFTDAGNTAEDFAANLRAGRKG